MTSVSSTVASSSGSGFTHLHLHSQYSLLDGAIRMKDLCPTVKELGMDSVAVTDHGNMFGAVHFYQEAKKHGIKPILGCEAYVAGPKGRADRTDRVNAHLILLAKNNEGYKNLSYMISMAYKEGFYYKPRVDMELLKAHSKGIYATSACLGGVVNRTLRREGEARAAEVAQEYAALFEPGHFFLELQDNGYAEQVRSNEALLNISELTGIPVVATADSHYLREEDSGAHEILMCIGQNQSLQEFRQKDFKHSDKLFVRSPQDMWNAFERLAPQAIENTQRIARDCNVELQLGQHFLPDFGVPEGYNLEGFLEKTATDGLARRIKEAKYPIDEAVYRQRLEYELGVICKMGFPGYFLIVWDFINYARDHNIPVGPGRGSGAGSLVAWSLRITDLDPIPYDLIFERFLNPERVSMPDFDIDFCQETRGDVIDYVTRKYGAANVGQIVTYSELSAKSGLKAVGRVMELPFAEVNELTKLIPNLINGKKVSVDAALEIEPKLQEVQREKPVYAEVIRITRALEGLNSSTGMHAAGIVIGDKPLWEYVPTCRGKQGELVTQFAKDEVELAGLVKFDFLGLKTLTVIANAIRHIRRREDVGPLGPNSEFGFDGVGFDDPKIYDLIASADTDGVFQLESSGFKELLKRLRPDCFEDIVAAVALYRPGPLDAGMVDDYVERKHGRADIVFPHPVCEPILGTTYGVIVYQEQVMRIAVDLCGFTMGGADKLRKAMGKKKADVMAAMRAQFVDGAHDKNGMAKEDADVLFTQIEKFAGYAFNKSHSAAYAVISYQTAFLKTYFPVEFMAALLSTEMGTQENVVKYIQSAREHGIRILPPDLQLSDRDFTVVLQPAVQKEDDDKGAQSAASTAAAEQERCILFGLGAVKGVGDSAIDAIVAARSENDSVFGSFYGFCEKVDLKKVNRKVIEALIRSGAADCFERPRSHFEHVLDRALELGAKTQRDLHTGQTSLFAAFAATQQTEVAGPAASTSDELYPDIDEWSEKLKLAHEKASLGFYITGHPLDRYAQDLGRLCSTTTVGLKTFVSNSNQRFTEVAIGGINSAYRERPLKSGKGRMAFLTLEDLHGTCEVIVFSKVFDECEQVMRSDEPLLVRGILSDEREEGGDIKIRASSIESLANARAARATKLDINLAAADINDDRLKELRAILAEHRGKVPTMLIVRDGKLSETVIKLPDYLNVHPTDELLSGVDRVFGQKVVQLG